MSNTRMSTNFLRVQKKSSRTDRGRWYGVPNLPPYLVNSEQSAFRRDVGDTAYFYRVTSPCLSAHRIFGRSSPYNRNYYKWIALHRAYFTDTDKDGNFVTTAFNPSADSYHLEDKGKWGKASSKGRVHTVTFAALPTRPNAEVTDSGFYTREETTTSTTTTTTNSDEREDVDDMPGVVLGPIKGRSRGRIGTDTDTGVGVMKPGRGRGLTLEKALEAMESNFASLSIE